MNQQPWKVRRRRSLVLMASLGLALALIGSACTSSKKSNTATDTGSKSSTTFKFRKLDSGGPVTVDALKSKSIDIAVLFSVDGNIAANKWVALDDDKHLNLPDHFVPAVKTSSNKADMAAVLNAVDAKLTQSAIQGMVKSVSIDGQDADAVAKDWLQTNGLPGSLKVAGSYTVGSANFTESEIVGYLYADALKAAGATVNVHNAIGAREVYLAALEQGQIDIVPEFTYSLLAYLQPSATPANSLDAVTSAAKTAAEAKGFTLLTPAAADDVNTYVVRPDTASKYSLKSLSDLAKVKTPLTMGGPPECPTRDSCMLGLQKVYGLHFTVE